MIFQPLVAIPPDEEDRDGPPKSRYVSKKDLKWLALGLIILLVLAYPIYVNLKDYSDSHVCAANMNAVYKALSNYEAEFDDRFPPVAEETDAQTGSPLMENGRAVTWVSLAQQYDNNKSIFMCPTADTKESVPNEGTSEEANGRTHVITVWSSYGMYRGYGTAMRSAIQNSSKVVLFAETSNYGADGSYDPLPMKDPTGQVVPYDGFSIGWDNGNVLPDVGAKKVTRLAFRNSAPGSKDEVYPRHRMGIHAITPDGNLRTLSPGDENVFWDNGEIGGRWSVPAFVKPR